ncbi:protein CREG1 [Nylanderia fulva]|uniref:protein CREG1 n=1 Tax=Nylanderia fulva TaxID=613905 RepID=UPI0010FB1D60|nr:protein CREG1 [Nylanderia fulva]
MMLRITISVIVFCVLLISEAHKLDDARVNYNKYWKEFQEFVKWKRTKQPDESSVDFLKRAIGFDDGRDSQRTTNQVIQDLPPKDQAALVARYVVNQADWAATATISIRKDVETFPVANLISISDGPIGNGTGIPYMYLTPLDFTAQDLAVDHRATLLVSLAEGSYCKDKNWDPMDPRCARVMLSGKIAVVKNNTKEHEIAKQLFFDRHPKLENMPADHGFFFAKLNIFAIALLNNFGGPKYISVEDYFNPPVNNFTDKLYKRFFAESI